MVAAVYANKFTVQIIDVARIIFVDERPTADSSLPMSQAAAGEVVMTIDNAKQLRDLLTETLSRAKL